MWKISFSIFFVLSIVISGLLFWQWSTYNDRADEGKGTEIENIEQEISVEAKNSSLKITQTITGFSADKEYQIEVPDAIKKWKCTIGDKKTCQSKDKNPNTFLAADGKLTVQYTLPIKGLNHSHLLNDWLASVPNTSIVHSTVEIIDYSKKAGTWVTGLPLKGSRKLDFISYYQFKGESETGSLYWQPKSLKNKEYYERLTVYYEGSNSPELKLSSLNSISDFPYFSVVISSNHGETNGKGVVIINHDTDDKLLEKRLIYTYFTSKFEDLPLEERWLLDVLTSLVVNQKSEMAKGNKMIKEIKGYLSESEIAGFLKEIYAEESAITTVKLDELFSKTLENKTHFFSLNKNEAMEFIPIFFYDQRMIVVNEVKKEKIEVINQESERLFPFGETMKALGYKVKVISEDDPILLSKGNNNYRFFLHDNIFVYNQRNFGLLENPLIKTNGSIYIKQKWLQSIFKVDISESGEEISLTSYE